MVFSFRCRKNTMDFTGMLDVLCVKTIGSALAGGTNRACARRVYAKRRSQLANNLPRKDTCGNRSGKRSKLKNMGFYRADARGRGLAFRASIFSPPYQPKQVNR